MNIDLPVIAGTLSTIIFFVGTFPMLHKAFHTRDLASYSKGMLVLNNSGNLVHAIYIFSLPPGPIWALHSFYMVTTALMLVWYLRYERRTSRPDTVILPTGRLHADPARPARLTAKAA